MSTRSQAELEIQLQARWAKVQSNAILPEQVFGNMEDWVVQLSQRKAFLNPSLKQWMWYDRLHNSWTSAGCGTGEAILITIKGAAGIKKLPQPEAVGEWCVYMVEQKLYGPLQMAELLDRLRSHQVPMDILVWSTRATSWLSITNTTGELSFYDEAGNVVPDIAEAYQESNSTAPE